MGPAVALMVMSMSLFTPRRPALTLPGTDARVIRRPDPRGLIVPEPSAAPMSPQEIDYDTLDILRSWRTYRDDSPGEVEYFCYQLRQDDPDTGVTEFVKVVKLVRLTRVPRYLRTTANAGVGSYSQMRDVLVGLREKRVLFLNLIAKSPQLPLVFAYGVQATGDTLEEATSCVEDAYAALTINLDGTYQQLEYAPLTFTDAELLARYQNEWRHIAAARGRPIPQGVSLGGAGALDGNRTDVDNANNQLESFIRGMGDQSFMLSLITAPVTPRDMSLAWQNVTDKLSAVRSDQQGQRGYSAGVALPLGLGASLGDTSSSSHGLTDTSGVGTSDGVNHSTAHGLTDTIGRNDSHGLTHTAGISDTDTSGTNSGHGGSTTATDGTNATQTDTAGTNHTDTAGTNSSTGTNTSATTGTSAAQSVSDAHGVSSGQTLTASTSSGSNWSTAAGTTTTAGHSLGADWSASGTSGTTGGWTNGQSFGDSSNASTTDSNGSDLSGGIPGLSGGQHTGTANQLGTGHNTGANYGYNGGYSSSATNGVGGSTMNSYSQGTTLSDTTGGSTSTGMSNATNVGTNQTVTSGQSLGTSTSTGTGTSDSHGLSTSAADGTSASRGLATGTSASTASGLTTSSGVSDSQARATSTSDATATTVGSSTSKASSDTDTSGTSSGTSTQNSLADAWQLAMARQATQSGSLGIVPTFSANVSKSTFDEAKRITGDILETQSKRYMDGVEGGGLLYQMFLVTENRPALVGGSSLLKSAFWGAGTDTNRLACPFMTTIIDDDAEAGRLLTHAAAFSTYRRREPVSDIIEPYLYSSYVTTGEASVMCHPPTSEAVGLQAMTDSMPVLAMPANRADRDIYLGRIVNGERGRVSDTRFGVDLNELTHILIQGVTGLGKTTTMLRLLEQVVALERTIVHPPSVHTPNVTTETARAGVLVLDWMHNARKLANVVPAERFQLFSVAHPHLGAFRFNPLALPHEGMDPGQWLGAQADNLSSSFGLGEYGRSIIAELIDALYTANRLEDFTLRPAVIDDVTGQVLRPGIVLPAIDEAQLPAGALALDAAGNRYANVYTCPALSRVVGLPDLAVLVATKVEEAATVEGARLYGTEMRNRLQSVWRRIQYYSPGTPLAAMLAGDPDLRTRQTMGVTDLIDTSRGLVTVIETDGLDLENRRVVLGSVMLAIYRYGLHVGSGAYDHNGTGPGTFIVLEEAHELFGEAGEGEDRASAAMRNHLYESLFRRARQTGLRLVAMTQNCGYIPAAITSQTTTVLVHRTYDNRDRERVFSLVNWSNAINQQQREWRYLGEMPAGYCIVRLNAKNSYLESAPAQILVDPPELPDVADETLVALAALRAGRPVAA